VIVPTPPVATMLVEYACPTVAEDMLVVEKTRAGALIMIMNGFIVLPEGSFTVTEME